jgi:sugar lactone lactonase YvrE
MAPSNEEHRDFVGTPLRVGFAMLLILIAVGCGGSGPRMTSTPTTPPQSTTPTGASPTVSSAPSGTPGPGTVLTIAGTGVDGHEGVGGQALQSQLSEPVDLAFDRSGNLYVAERYAARVVVIRPDGTVALAAGLLGADGKPMRGFSGDGGPATMARLDGASAVTVDADGNLFIADTLNNRIRKVDRAGTITTVAGTGEQGYSGDGGPAVEARLHWPTGLVVDRAGNLYVADGVALRIRRIAASGLISTVAGTGEPGLAPDGTPAVSAAMGRTDDHLPNGLAFDPAGRLHITDYGNFRIWLVDAEGALRTAAGIGSFTSFGDGGPATAAGISGPLDICFDVSGNLYIATHTHGSIGNEIRLVSPDGLISTLAGTGALGFGGDGGPAVAAVFAIPSSVAMGPDGNLYVADAGNHRIRMVVLPPPA